jgi:hypothetical protein
VSEIFEVALCKMVEKWQAEFNDMQDREEVLEELTGAGYRMLDALGIFPEAIPHTNTMKFWKGKKLIYGPRQK